MKKAAIITASLLCLMAGAGAQKTVTIDWYGFVMAQTYVNTRTSASGAGGFLYLYPLDERIVNFETNDDLNANMHASYFGALARVGMNLKAPDLFGAKSKARVEIDLTGFNPTDNPILYRHAYMGLDWDRSSLTLGQTWHPLSELFPSTVSIAIGSPFNALNRSPQLRYDKFLGQNREFKLSAAALFQYLSASTGPKGRTGEYHRNSAVPEFYIGAQINTGGFMFGIGGEWQRVAPRVESPSGVKVNEYINTFAGMVQAGYEEGLLSWKGKILLGQNMSNLGICSGYGEAVTEDGTLEWRPLTAVSSWTHFSYGNELKVGLFGGYMKNLGGKEGLTFQKLYVIGGDKIDAMYRIAPNVSYTVNNMNLACEYDMTSVAYGDRQARGNVANSHWVTNNRVLLSVTYMF